VGEIEVTGSFTTQEAGLFSRFVQFTRASAKFQFAEIRVLKRGLFYQSPFLVRPAWAMTIGARPEHTWQ